LTSAVKGSVFCAMKYALKLLAIMKYLVKKT